MVIHCHCQNKTTFLPLVVVSGLDQWSNVQLCSVVFIWIHPRIHKTALQHHFCCRLLLSLFLERYFFAVGRLLLVGVE